MSRIVFELVIEDVSGEVGELVSMQPYGDLETAQRAASKFYEGKVGKWPSWIEWVQAGRTHWSADAGQWVFGITQRKIK